MARRRTPRRDRPRLLMLGGINHPHVEHLALAMRERSFELVVGGDVVPGLPRSVLADAGVRLYPAPRHRRGSLRGVIAHVRWIRELIRRERPDVVHAHWLCGYAAFAAIAQASPLVSMAWGSDVFRAGPLERLADRLALRRSTLAMADSQALLDALVALGADRTQCRLINWGVDLGHFAPLDDGRRAALRAQLGLGNGPVILSMRSLMPIYNPHVILAAWARIAATHPDAQLVIKHMGVVTTELGAIPFADRVHVVGHVPYERMADYYQAADVAISLASSDSSPRSVFEAMACGTPCVLSELPWVHELIRDGREATVVPIEVDALAGAVEALLDAPDERRRMSAAARVLAVRAQDGEAHMDRLADAYREVIAA